uniref:Small nuclear ribonucleoprotein E n=2 Tax=Ornithorhynchus anatinus TaxID=9258 RepID=F6VY87_ORNAN
MKGLVKFSRVFPPIEQSVLVQSWASPRAPPVPPAEKSQLVQSRPSHRLPGKKRKSLLGEPEVAPGGRLREAAAILWNGPAMAYRGQGQKVQKVMVQPINLIFRYLQNRSRIQVWLYEQVNMRIEGCIIGFDEYMNLVLDDAEEIHSKTKSRKQLGRVMLKGDNITLLQSVSN